MTLDDITNYMGLLNSTDLGKNTTEKTGEVYKIKNTASYITNGIDATLIIIFDDNLVIRATVTVTKTNQSVIICRFSDEGKYLGFLPAYNWCARNFTEEEYFQESLVRKLTLSYTQHKNVLHFMRLVDRMKFVNMK